MRRILVDHARAPAPPASAAARAGARPARRRRRARRRGAAPTCSLALDEALDRLAALDARQARVVECRFFGGLTEEETAEALGIGRAHGRSATGRRRAAWLYRDARTRHRPPAGTRRDARQPERCRAIERRRSTRRSTSRPPSAPRSSTPPAPTTPRCAPRSQRCSPLRALPARASSTTPAPQHAPRRCSRRRRRDAPRAPERVGPYRIVARARARRHGHRLPRRARRRAVPAARGAQARARRRSHRRARARASSPSGSILAPLEHPHIARLLDGGVTADGAAVVRDGVRRGRAARPLVRRRAALPLDARLRAVPRRVRRRAVRAPAAWSCTATSSRRTSS